MERSRDNICRKSSQMPYASAAPAFFTINAKWQPVLGARAHRTRRPIPLEELMG